MGGADADARHERTSKIRQMDAGIERKRKQSFRNLRKLAVVVVMGAAVAGWAGYKLGSQPPRVMEVQLLSPIPALTTPGK